MGSPAEQPTPPAVRLIRHLHRLFSGGLYRAADQPAQRHYRGDYRATADELFRIEDVGPERAIVERVRTGELLDVGVEELDELQPVRSD